MKLKSGVLLHNVGDDFLGITQGEAAKSFSGMLRNNKTAHDIFVFLQNDTTEEKIVENMLEIYDAPKEIIAQDVHSVIEQIRKLGLLEE